MPNIAQCEELKVGEQPQKKKKNKQKNCDEDEEISIIDSIFEFSDDQITHLKKNNKDISVKDSQEISEIKDRLFEFSLKLLKEFNNAELQQEFIQMSKDVLFVMKD